MARPTRGWSLVEVIVALALAAACLLCVLGLIPYGVLSLKRAEDLQAATAYGVEVVNACRSGALTLDAPWQARFTLNDTPFVVVRDTRMVPGSDGRLVDVWVTITWPRQGRPVVLGTRMRARSRVEGTR